MFTKETVGGTLNFFFYYFFLTGRDYCAQKQCDSNFVL